MEKIFKKVNLGDYVVFDSNVHTGGGTVQTEKIQEVLDKAEEWGGLYLVVEGAVNTGALKIHSNTTIKCVNSDCGFYLADNTNLPMFRNAHPHLKDIKDRNIVFSGGTYNFNCLNQTHNTMAEDPHYKDIMPVYPGTVADGVFYPHGTDTWVYGFYFAGVDNMIIRDVTTVDQRTFTMTFVNWRHVFIENLHIDLPNNMYGQNQDGLHFFGPGRFLTIKNIRGCTGDDFIALAPDEVDLESDIYDVVIDGVHLDNADQGIRMLSRGKGRLDRVIVRNVTGTYRSFGFFINPWFHDENTRGNYGSITIENVDLEQIDHKYGYTNPLLFRLGGEIENITFRNIKNHFNDKNGVAFQLGGFYDAESTKEYIPCKIGSLVIDGAYCTGADGNKQIFIENKTDIENLILHNISAEGDVVKMRDSSSIKNALISNVITGGSVFDSGKNVENAALNGIISK